MCKTIRVNAVNKKYKYKNKYYNRPLKIEKISEGTILPLRENKGGVLNKNTMTESGLSWEENIRRNQF